MKESEAAKEARNAARITKQTNSNGVKLPFHGNHSPAKIVAIKKTAKEFMRLATHDLKKQLPEDVMVSNSQCYIHVQIHAIT